MVPSERLAWLLCLIGYSVVRARTIYLEVNNPSSEEVSFLKKYGYIPEEQGDVDFAYTPQSIADGLRKMQAFAGLPETGEMDTETKKLFKRKRCGVRDIGVSSRNRRYVIQQGWNKRYITYRVLNGSSTLPKSRVEALMEEGLSVWAPHGGLTFAQLEDGEADIEVYFANGDHGDGFPFDGQGRVVAHAFPPPHGAMHFDDDEVWGENVSESAEEDDVTDFFAVAVHEIGHALGLSHSSVKSSVMYPYYQVPVERLFMDDILGMQELYLHESPTASPDMEYASAAPVPKFTKANSDEEEEDEGEEEGEENYMPDLCMTNYDTLQVIQGKIYVFEEEWVWVLRERNQLEEGFPQRFHAVFRGLPHHVNIVKTIYENSHGHVFIFYGRQYWEFSPEFSLVKRGNIADYGVPSDVPELTTVFVSNYNNKTYLIEEERFWRYDEIAGIMDPGYPKDMSAWRQLPYPVDAAIIWKEDTYFFQGPRFWRFDNTAVMAHPYYPLPVAQIWFDCPVSPEMNVYVTNDGP